jgi:hypothetical protein
MSSVLRIALAYFQIVPAQRWVHVAALVLMMPAALMLAFGDVARGAREVFPFVLFGVILVLLTPGFGGGIALRLASTRHMLHLRPHGRLRVLLGSTLALTLLAALATVPALAAVLYDLIHGTDSRGSLPRPLESFQVGWAFLTLLWIGMFALSRTPVALFLFGLVPIAVVKFGELVRDWFPGITGTHVFVAGAGAWVLFALWYLTAGNIRRPVNLPPLSLKTGGEFSPFEFFLKADSERPGQNLRAAAVSQYLFGCASHRLFVLNGIWIAAIFVLVSMLGHEGRARGPGNLLVMVPLLAFMCATVGYTTARRARFLWLRAGVDRAGLFAMASRLGLQAALTTWAIVAGAIGLLAIAREPAHMPGALLFLASQAAVAICMFYGGLAIVREWSASDIVVIIGLAILAVLQVGVFGTNQIGNVILPWTTVLVLASVLAIMLRWYAHHRWRALDWRLIKVGRLDWRQG